MLLARLFLLTLCLAACARRTPEPEVFSDRPMVQAAVREWQLWGRVVIIGWPDERPSDTAASPERVARLLDYWNALPGGWRIAQRHAELRSGMAAMERRVGGETATEGETAASTPVVVGLNDIAYFSHPAWSAAFISAVARLAHLPESDLPSSSRHAFYIDAMLMNALANPDGAAFRPHAPEEYAPVPGDLICADRAWVPISHWTQRLAERGRPRPMHCDVVVRTGRGTVDAIGGNVQALVAMRRFPADAHGRLLPAPFGKAPFVLVLAVQGAAATP